MATLELGIDTFGDVTEDADGHPLTYGQVLRNVVEEGVLADQVGLDFIGIGEHHRKDFAVSAPEIVLGAIAGRTTNIHLGTAVTVLSSDDPVRVFERFATLDGISGGRAEVILGRGSFIESFPLFGFDLTQYEELFEEKLNLFAELLTEEPVTWTGRLRASLENQSVYPKLENGPLKAWVGVGGSPESVVRAAHYGLPLMLAIIGGGPLRFQPLTELYKRALEQFGRSTDLPIGVHSPGFIAETDEEAKEILWPHYETMNNRIGRERGWPPATRARFEHEAGEDGALVVGSPETVARKIAFAAKGLGLTRFDLKISNGALGHDHLMKAIELYGTQVRPMVEDLLA
jgi:probable LLM family oxidoreductase